MTLKLSSTTDMSSSNNKNALAGLTLGALGVVYGDIGTSVLYAMKEVFASGHVAFTPDNIFGILSLFFLDPDHHCVGQVCDAGPARRQQRRGGAGGYAGLGFVFGARQAPTALGAVAGGDFWHLPLLRRWGHHPGHFGAVCR